MSDNDGSGDDYATFRSKRNSNGSGYERSMTRDYKDRSGRGGDRGRGGRNDYDRRHSRDHDRRRDYDQGRDRDRGDRGERERERDRDRRPRHRERSRSKERSRSPSSSRSRSKSKRGSFFDVAPPSVNMMPGADMPGQLLAVPQTTPGVVPNMLPFGTTQLSLPMMPAQAMTQQATRHARRVYVGGLPPLANEQTIATFFSGVMAAIGGNSSGSGDAVVNVYINHEKKFAFVEMRTVEEASNAMALDGIIFEGVAVRVRRPTDYNPALAATLGPSQPSPHLNLAAVGLIPGAITGAEGPERVFVGGLPYYFTEEQIKELLESFGPLRGFDLVKDKDTGNSKGYGFCVYQDPAVTDIACASLNGLKMGDKTLTVRRATMSAGQSKSEQDSILAQAQQHIAIQKMALQAGGVRLPVGGMGFGGNGESPTKILCLTEAISADQLANDEEYEEILEDMKDECGKFGTVVNVIIPRPSSQSGEPTSGVGKVFLEYADTTGCANARNVLNGRKFGGNIVNAVYYPEDRYYSKDFSYSA
ncbi:splicing factor U2af large subunit B isoform X2 [Cannabis sativa]|uniref:splicing factor U2af large subunit B isoform X2 n=2 Tax=Cannabis sativa TaxID=3483 RepID=UPI0011DFD7C3|nr:splicing factor U2af large subunit B isoform X2 [Cannabis sativa]